MKHLLRIGCFILALSMLVTLCACADTTVDPEVTTAPTEATVETGAPETTSLFVSDDIPDSLNFGGETVSFLYWSDVERHEFFVDDADMTGNIIDTRINERNAVVENRLGIKLEWIGTPGNYDNQKQFVQAANNSIISGGTYDIFAGYSMVGSSLATAGLVQNLLALEHLNFDKPWWPKSLVENATIKNKLYFASGDISTSMLYFMYSCFFNKNMLVEEHSDMKADDMYAIVDNGQWTLDKLIELSEGVYSDLNASNTVDYEDKFGFGTADVHFDAFYISGGLKYIEKDQDGAMIMSADMESEKALSLLDKANSFIHTSGYAYSNMASSSFSSVRAFNGNRLLFTMDRVYIASGSLADVSDFEYGILPVPKYDEEQKEYVTCMAFPFTVYTISAKSHNSEAAAAALECLASEGYRRVTPALFEQSMKVRYSDAPADARMYDLLRSSVSMDLGRLFTASLNNLTFSLFRTAMKNNATASWTTQVKGNKAILNKLIQNVNNVVDQ